MNENEPRILIISDVHLGALNSNLEQFTLFLNKIINGEFGDYLQVLLILGDFIDLGTTVRSTFFIDDKITDIFNLLLKIKKKIPIVFVPGNHEIPVTSSLTSGNYDEKFKKRKTKFLELFGDSLIGEIFESNMVCQYIILEKSENGGALLLYDSQDQIYNLPNHRIKVENLDLEENYKCLMLHGYQFESDAIRIFVTPFWKSMISYGNLEIKEVYNYFWNVIIKENRKIKPITIEDMKSDLARLRGLTPEEIDAIFLDLSNLEFNLIKLNMKVMQKYRNARKLSYYIDGIEEFFEEAKGDFSTINRIVYGHSHIKGISNETINNLNVKLVNCGNWDYSSSSYVEILHEGKIILKIIDV